MTVRTASDQSELNSALAALVSGDELRLIGGSTFNDLNLSSKTFSPVVTITATGDVTLDQIDLNGVDGLTVDFSDGSGGRHIMQWGDTNGVDTSNIIEIDNSANLIFKNMHCKGRTDGSGLGIGECFVVNASDEITIENNLIETVFRGIMGGNLTTNFNILDNEIRFQQGDGMQFSYCRDVLIQGNYIHDCIDDGPAGTHSDGVQWAAIAQSAGETTERITIRGNTFDIGDGAYFQCIFMRNEAVDLNGLGSEMYYQDILIEDNVIYGTHTHGITVGATDGLTIRRNTLVQPAANENNSTNAARTEGYPNIRLSGDDNDLSTNVTVEDNVVNSIVDENLYTWSGGNSKSGNVLIQQADYDANFNYNGKDYDSYSAGPNEWDVKADSTIDTAQAGAPSMLPGGGGVSVMNRTASIAATSSVSARGFTGMSNTISGGTVSWSGRPPFANEITANEAAWRYANVIARPASIVSVSTVQAAPVRVIRRAVSCAATSALTSDATRIAVRAASISATSTLSAVPAVTHRRSATCAATSTLATSSTLLKRRAASAAATSTVNTAAHLVRRRAATCSAVSSLTAVPEVSGAATASVSIAATSSIAVAGNVIRRRAAAIAAESGATAAAQAVLRRSATVASSTTATAAAQATRRRGAVVSAQSGTTIAWAMGTRRTASVVAASSASAQPRIVRRRTVAISTASTASGAATLRLPRKVLIAANSDAQVQGRRIANRQVAIGAISAVSVQAYLNITVFYREPGSSYFGGDLPPSRHDGNLSPSRHDGDLKRYEA